MTDNKGLLFLCQLSRLLPLSPPNLREGLEDEVSAFACNYLVKLINNVRTLGLFSPVSLSISMRFVYAPHPFPLHLPACGTRPPE